MFQDSFFQIISDSCVQNCLCIISNDVDEEIVILHFTNVEIRDETDSSFVGMTMSELSSHHSLCQPTYTSCHPEELRDLFNSRNTQIQIPPIVGMTTWEERRKDKVGVIIPLSSMSSRRRRDLFNQVTQENRFLLRRNDNVGRTSEGQCRSYRPAAVCVNQLTLRVIPKN